MTLPVEAALQGGSLAFVEAQEALEEIFEDIIKDEVAHTLKIAEQAGEDIFGILPRLRRAMPQLAEYSNDTLWGALTFEIVPQLSLRDMGQKR